ncbi:MAG: Membrane-bound lytic murein transglycosylase C [Paracidovorax wautersii]|uniref:Membrane-bound lytic murein transglycosylase C n=1 Tax=Paracidovorax wautersii TaxID=1177982 RepID=A0A7V8JPH2_9BURK|nr:MAG: Membrane-bound lytic murein transglycosylase C [Paracidovorax wautersii]
MNVLMDAGRGLRICASDVTRGFFEICHNGLALVGLALTFVVVALLARPDLRQSGEAYLMSWLQNRHTAAQVATAGMKPEPEVIERVRAADPTQLNQQQAAVTHWLSKKYRVAPEPLSVLVTEAWSVGASARLDPTLILAVMAIESRFNPFSQSPVGAQGLMQVMTRVHTEKYDHFGGNLAAFDPVANLRVGIKVLQDCVKNSGSIEGGLRCYVGAGGHGNDGGYVTKVMGEYQRLRGVAGGSAPKMMAPLRAPAPASPAVEPPAGSPSLEADTRPQHAPQNARGTVVANS